MKNAAAYVAEHNVLTFTSVTVYEIMTGLEQSQDLAKMARVRALLLQKEEVLRLSEDYLLAANILGSLRRTGKEVGYSDPLIAACAIRRTLTVVTGNQKHFRFIQATGFPLKLKNWREAYRCVLCGKQAVLAVAESSTPHSSIVRLVQVGLQNTSYGK
jgi:predicted nucleic acid-binding protein